MGLLIIIYGWYDFYKLIQGMFWFFFLINMSIQVSLHIPRLIPQTLKLTII
jgi:hypothetical protein